ncbi:hypothetical protein FCL40_05695 [Ferrimonas sediminicola]|uniref:Dirigent-like protein n=1 Tax=Ferrimonas sediminicola TaxID=2569538 RepID=A0A4U1BHC5_9GAMM|nr:hypothetical protein [Ferrimonas sediminicola]TKB50641.1 hypothetical protein FCL40_05695 [Ferrimonas sediminicola]
MKTLLRMISAVSLLCLTSAPAWANEQGAGDLLVLNLVGTGEMYQSTVPDIDGDGMDDDAICFDVQLMDANNRRHIGSATDCLSNITPVGSGIALVGTTFFHLPQGTLVTRGNTSVQPVVHNTVTPSGQTITHVTGAAGTGNAILWGSKRFAGAMGTVRLSGMVDLTRFAGNPGDPMGFDCLFVIHLY